MSAVYIAPVSFGLGDLVVSLPAVQSLIGNGVETWLVARSPVQAALAGRIDGLAGHVTEDTLDHTDLDGRLVDLRDHPLQREHWWGSPEFERAYGGLRINDILDRICRDAGIVADFARPVPLTSSRRPEVASSVVFVMDTDGPTKRWPDDRWVALAAELGRHGIDVRTITRDARSNGDIEAVCAPTPGDAVDVLSSARAVVGVDTGLTHVAVQQETPTVTICRPSNVYVRPWAHTRAVTGDPCDPVCVAAEQDYAYNDRVDLRDFEWQPRRCPVDGRCLEAVQLEHVTRALEEVL
jgi:Glycosyltransferase family 9 (heptosyltransferase)